ncbi:Qat anti-phage system associated protein QatB [Bradyrhizobium sp. 14AA]
MPSRFTAPRTNFSKFARSGGSDRGSLGRAVSGYVSTAAGGARQAARRMGASRGAGARLYAFLSDAQARGPVEALRALNLGALAGRPIDEVFVGLADYVCPEGGSVDDGIARDAFIDTIADLAGEGISDLNSLTADQMQTVFEIFATHAIEARIFNDIGKNGIKLPSDVAAVTRVQDQLHDFVQRAVSDALTSARAEAGPLTQDRALRYVESVYEAAFDVLQTLGEGVAHL